MSSTDSENQEIENPETQPSVAGQPPGITDAMNAACRREITVEIPAELARKQWEGIIHNYSKQARVPGFRKGKVPASIIRKRFGQEIKSDVLESLVPQHFREAVLREGLMPVSQPVVSNLEMEEGQPIRFKAVFEVLPEIELTDYQDIKVEKPEVQVTDEEVENELKRLQERQASYDPVNEDRALEDGDFAQITFKAIPHPASNSEEKEEKEETAPAEPVEVEEVLVEIGGPNTIADFSENLRGAKPGEERTFNVTYPADFYDNRLAGKTLSYTAKINAIKKKTTPELNDEFAKELSQDFQTLDALKTRIREGILGQRKHKAEHEAKEKLLNELVEKHDFPVPHSMVEHQIDVRLERGLRALAAQGMKTEDMKRMDFARLRVAQREAALKEVKSNLLLEKIAHAENIQVSDEELDKEIETLAQQMNQTTEAVRQRLAEDGAMERIRDRMRSEKALELLYSKSA